MLRVGRNLIWALTFAVALGGAAWGQAPSTTALAPKFPESRAPDELRSWIREESDLDADAVVAVTPGAVTAILSYMSTPEGLQRVNLRSEATSAEAYAKDGVLSWTSVVELDCKRRRARLGRTMAYSERNLVGDGRETVAASPKWITPTADGAAYNAMRKVCGGEIINPLNRARPVQVAQAPPEPAPVAVAPSTPPPVAASPPLRPPPPPPKSPQASSRSVPPASAIVVAPGAKVTSTHPVIFAAEPPPAPTPAAPVRPGRVTVQVSASSTPREAKQALAAAEARAGGLPPGVSVRVEKAMVRGRIYFRAQFAGFQTPADAETFCRTAASSRGCLVKVNPGGRR